MKNLDNTIEIWTDKERKAMTIAEEQHKNQMYGEHKYIKHLLDCAKIAKFLNFSENVVIACFLHDIIEDTAYNYNDIKNNFDKTVAEIVYAVTDELGRNRKERKIKTYPKIRENNDAILVKICDRIANIRFSKINSKEKMNMYLNEKDDFFKNIISNRINHNYYINIAYEILLKEYENI